MSALFRSAAHLDWSELRFERDLEPAEVSEFVLGVVSGAQLGRTVFEIHATTGEPKFLAGSENSFGLDQLRSVALRNMHITSNTRPDIRARFVVDARLSTTRRQLRIEDPTGFTARLLGALRSLGDGAIYQVVVDQRLRPELVPADTAGFDSESWGGQLWQAAWSGKRPMSSDARRALGLKRALPGAKTTIRFGFDAEQAQGQIAALLRTLESPGVHFTLARSSLDVLAAASPARKAPALNRDELQCVLGWPSGDRSYPGLSRTGSISLPVTLPPARKRIIGIGTHPTSRIPVGISAEDARRHTHVIGPTGTGKSTALAHLVCQDIADGKGLVLIEPKGDLVDEVLARVAPADLDRIVVLDPARADFAVGFNPLAVARSERELAVDGVLHAFSQLHADSWGPRSSDLLHSSLLTLIGTPWASILFVPRLLAEPGFRRKVLAQVTLPPTLRSFWIWFDGLSDAERASVIAPIMNKTRPLLTRSAVRGMLGQVEPGFDPRTVFTKRKVLLVPLRKGVIGPVAANLIGSLIVSRIWQLALQRSEIPAERRHMVPLVADEFQDYLALPTDFADVLAQARGLGLGLVVAHQHLRQLAPDMRAAVLANAQNRIMFRLSSEDADKLAPSLPGVEADDLRELDRYQAYVRQLASGRLQPVCSIRTLPPSPTSRSAKEAAEQLAKRDGRPLSEIDAELFADEQDDPDEPIGGRKRGAQ